MNTIVFGCGGTGCRVVNALLYWLAAQPIFDRDRQVIPILVDSDTTGTAMTDCRTALSSYRSAAMLKSGTVFPPIVTEIQDFDRWHPQGAANLMVGASLVGNDDESAILTQACFTKVELEQKISSGFYGRPALGAGVLRKQIHSQDQGAFWSRFEERSEVKAGADTFVLVGSVFGGTGAATIPFLIERLRRNSRLKDKKIAAVLLLPYFTFNFDAEQERSARAHGDLIPEPSQFMANALVATNYFLHNLSFEIDYLYLIGDPAYQNNNLSENILQSQLGRRLGISRGGDQQKTPMFFHDFIAGSGILDVIRRSAATQARPAERLVYTAGVDTSRLGWSQLAPIPFSVSATDTHALATFARFAYITLLFADRWISKPRIDSDYRKAPFLSDLRQDSEGDKRWRDMAAFLQAFRLNLQDVEVTARCDGATNGFVNREVWARDLEPWPESESKWPAFSPDAAANHFATAVKEMSPRAGSALDAWNQICLRLPGATTHAEFVRRLSVLARSF